MTNPCKSQEKSIHTCNNFDKSKNLSKIQKKDGVTGQGNDRSWAWWKYFGSKHIPGSEIEGEKYIVLFSTLGQEFETWSMVAGSSLQNRRTTVCWFFDPRNFKLTWSLYLAMSPYNLFIHSQRFCFSEWSTRHWAHIQTYRTARTVEPGETTGQTWMPFKLDNFRGPLCWAAFATLAMYCDGYYISV